MYYKNNTNILPILSSPIYINQNSLQYIDLQKDGAASRYFIH